MKWHISSLHFTKLDNFLPFVTYMVEWSLGNKKIVFSADQLIIQKRKLDFSITKPCRYQFEVSIFNQERLLPILYLVPLPPYLILINFCLFFLPEKSRW